MAAPSRSVIYVTVDGFFQRSTERRLDELVSLTDELNRALARHAEGWRRPSANEAVLTSEAPWGQHSKPLDWADALRRGVSEDIGLDCSVGIAATRVAARMCSRIARPRGVLMWLDGYEDGLVASLPLEELDELRPDQLAGLRARGIRTLGEMSELPSDDARALLGSESAKLVGLVRGLGDTTARGDNSRLFRGVVLLARRLARRLESSGVQARGLELGIVFDDGVTRQRYTLLPRAASEQDLLELAACRLLGMSPRRERAVTGLSLTATGLTGPGAQLSLFRGSGPREVAVQLGRSG